jgi:chemotaxis signal transduction protein
MTAVEPEATPILTFALEGARFAVALANVSQVVLRPALAAIPGAPDTLVGLLALRGQPVVVADLRPLIGLAGRSTSPPAVVVIDGTPAPLGLAVDALPRVESLPAGNLLPAPPELAGHDTIVLGRSESTTLLAADAIAADPRMLARPPGTALHRTAPPPPSRKEPV